MKLRIYNYSILFCLGLVFLNSCERDDICPPSTPTTPKVIIKFFDVEDSSETKTVVNLSYRVEGSSENVELGTVDSIALPLDTNGNTTRFELIRNTEDENFENIDEIFFTYQVDDIFVSRACGFKAVYTNLSATRVAEDVPADNWIRSINVELDDVENEQNTHVFILH